MSERLSIKDTVQQWVSKINDILDLNTVDGSFRIESQDGDLRTIQFSGGRVRSGSTLKEIPGRELTFPVSKTSIVGINLTSDLIERYDLASVPGTDFVPIWEVKTNNITFYSIEDFRTWAFDDAGIASDLLSQHVAETDPHSQYVLEDELNSSSIGTGSDLIVHTGTSDTVTEALDKRTIYVGSVAELISGDFNFSSLASTQATVYVQQNNYNSDPGGSAHYRILTVAEYGGTPDGTTLGGIPTGADHYVGGGTDYVAKLEPVDGKFRAEMFGVNVDMNSSDSTKVINNALDFLDGRPLYLPSKRLKYSGYYTGQSACIIGERVPHPNDTRTALVDGSILEGSMTLRSLHVVAHGFGVDHGADAFPAAPANGFVCSPSVASSGKSLWVSDIVGLGSSPDDAYHAILLEGYKNIQAGRLHGIRTIFGVVIKAERGNVDNIIATENGTISVIIKSDTASGVTRNLNIGSIIVDGLGESGLGVDLQAAGNQLQQINIGMIDVKGAAKAFRIQSDGVGSGVSNTINVGMITGDGMSNDAIATTGAGNTFYSTDFVKVGVNASRTQFSNISLLNQYGGLGAGVISYENARGTNKLVQYNCKLTGSGAPIPTGVAVTVDGSPFTAYKVARVRLSSNPGGNNFVINSDNVEIGWQMFIYNDTGANVTTQMADGTPVLFMPDQFAALFVFDGSTYRQQTGT